MSRFFYARPPSPEQVAALAAMEAAIRPILHGVVDPWTKDDFELWVDGLTRTVAGAALRALSDSDGTPTGAINEDLSDPKDCQARAESIAQGPSHEQ